MARGVTQDQVTRAADALLARGERPTIEKVRAELGTGSPNTLLRLLEVWWAELAGRLAAQARAQLPDIPETVQRAMMTLWSEAVVATRQETEARYAEREQALEARETALLTQLEQLASREAAQQEVLVLSQRQCEALKADFTNERRRADDLQQSLATALYSLTEAQAAVAASRRASEAAQKAFRIDRERGEATEQRWLREVDRAREEAKTAAREAGSARGKLAKETKRRVEAEKELMLHKRRLKHLERRISPNNKEKTTPKVKQSADRKRKAAMQPN